MNRFAIGTKSFKQVGSGSSFEKNLDSLDFAHAYDGEYWQVNTEVSLVDIGHHFLFMSHSQTHKAL